MRLEDLIKLNPKLTLKKGVPAPFIEMAALPTNEKFIHEIGQREAIGSGAKFQNGDTLFARITPCLENGKGGYVSGLPDGVVGQGSTEFIVLRARKKSDEQFAYYLSRFQKFRNFAEKGMEGTSGRQRVTWQTLADFELPDLSKMQRTAIGEVLASLDDKIELNRRMNETLEEMARALFRDWFIDFGPTRRQMDGATDPAAILGHAFPNDKAATLAPLFPARLGENGLPEGWDWGAVSDLADLNPKSWTVKKHPEQVDYLDLGNTKWGRIEETTGYLWSEAPSRAKRILEPGDTIVGTVRPGNGSYALIGREGLTGSTGFAVLRPKHLSVTEFVYLALTSPENINILANLADGGAYPAINPKVVADTKIVLADSKVIEDFSNLTQSMFAKRHFNEQESQTLAQIRDLLLPKLMSREIQLKDEPMVQDNLDGYSQEP